MLKKVRKVVFNFFRKKKSKIPKHTLLEFQDDIDEYLIPIAGEDSNELWSTDKQSRDESVNIVPLNADKDNRNENPKSNFKFKLKNFSKIFNLHRKSKNQRRMKNCELLSNYSQNEVKANNRSRNMHDKILVSNKKVPPFSMQIFAINEKCPPKNRGDGDDKTYDHQSSEILYQSSSNELRNDNECNGKENESSVSVKNKFTNVYEEVVPYDSELDCKIDSERNIQNNFEIKDEECENRQDNEFYGSDVRYKFECDWDDFECIEEPFEQECNNVEYSDKTDVDVYCVVDAAQNKEEMALIPYKKRRNYDFKEGYQQFLLHNYKCKNDFQKSVQDNCQSNGDAIKNFQNIYKYNKFFYRSVVCCKFKHKDEDYEYDCGNFDCENCVFEHNREHFKYDDKTYHKSFCNIAFDKNKYVCYGMEIENVKIKDMSIIPYKKCEYYDFNGPETHFVRNYKSENTGKRVRDNYELDFFLALCKNALDNYKYNAEFPPDVFCYNFKCKDKTYESVKIDFEYDVKNYINSYDKFEFASGAYNGTAYYDIKVDDEYVKERAIIPYKVRGNFLAHVSAESENRPNINKAGKQIKCVKFEREFHEGFCEGVFPRLFHKSHLLADWESNYESFIEYCDKNAEARFSSNVLPVEKMDYNADSPESYNFRSPFTDVNERGMFTALCCCTFDGNYINDKSLQNKDVFRNILLLFIFWNIILLIPKF